MMRRWIAIFLLMALAAAAQAEEKYRDFTDTQGRTIRGRVLLYNDVNGEVRFERENGRTAKVPLTIFSEKDQAYIKEWSSAKAFSSKSSFKIDVRRMRKENERKSQSDHNSTRKVEDTYYEITLENRTGEELKNLQVEYCIFYEQEEIKRGEQVLNQGVYHGKSTIESIPVREETVFTTHPVSTYKQELDSDWYYGNPKTGSSGIENVQDGDVHGVWVRVYLTLSTGDKVTREVVYPNSINNSRYWTTSSVRAGLN